MLPHGLGAIRAGLAAEPAVHRDTEVGEVARGRGLPAAQPGDARVFLGIVLPIDGVAGLRRRQATASRYLSDFGVAMYCGFGRQPGADGTETMREHARVVRDARGR